MGGSGSRRTHGNCPSKEILDEAAHAGYAAVELGRYGWLPTHPEQLSDEEPHADAHVDNEQQIERFLDVTDPVTGLAGPGHRVRRLRRWRQPRDRGQAPDRIGYMHLKCVDPNVLARVRTEGMSFADAMRSGGRGRTGPTG